MNGITIFCNITMPFNDRERACHFLNICRCIIYIWFIHGSGLNTFMKLENFSKTIVCVVCKLKFKRKIKNCCICTTIKLFQFKFYRTFFFNFSISDLFQVFYLLYFFNQQGKFFITYFLKFFL